MDAHKNTFLQYRQRLQRDQLEIHSQKKRQLNHSMTNV